MPLLAVLASIASAHPLHHSTPDQNQGYYDYTPDQNKGYYDYDSPESLEDSYRVEKVRFDDKKNLVEYKVSNDDVKVFHTRNQYIQEDGTVVGEYALLEADGKTVRIVKYTAGKDGFRPVITYTDDLSVFWWNLLLSGWPLTCHDH